MSDQTKAALEAETLGAENRREAHKTISVLATFGPGQPFAQTQRLSLAGTLAGAIQQWQTASCWIWPED